jgi:hypothetical protein
MWYFRTRILSASLLLMFTAPAAYALEYRGVTANIPRGSDPLTTVDSTCNSTYAGSRAATFGEMTALYNSGAAVSATALVTTKSMGSWQTNYGTEGGSSDAFAYFPDGAFLTNTSASISSSCHSSTSSGVTSPAFGSAGKTTLNCGSDRPWHCVSGDLAGGGSGDNLGNHTATQALNMGGFAVNSASGYFHSSDASLKANISKLSGWEILKHITGYSYDWKNGGGASAGVLAQEVEKVLPSAVATDAKTGTKSVEYDQLIAPMIEAIKELKAENAAMREESREMRDEIKALKRQE